MIKQREALAERTVARDIGEPMKMLGQSRTRSGLLLWICGILLIVSVIFAGFYIRQLKHDARATSAALDSTRQQIAITTQNADALAQAKKDIEAKMAAAEAARTDSESKLKLAEAAQSELNAKVKATEAAQAEAEAKSKGAEAARAEFDSKLKRAEATIAELDAKLKAADAKLRDAETARVEAEAKLKAATEKP